MSNKDETDLVRNTESTEKSNHMHDLSNGDTTMNGNSSKNLDESNKSTSFGESTERKSNTPSNWVQFENEDDNDKVLNNKHLFYA